MTARADSDNRHSRRVGALASLCAAVVVAVVTALPGQTDAAPPAAEARGCSDFTPAAAALESQESFDPRTGDLQVITGADTYVLNEQNATCRSNAAARWRLDQNRIAQDEDRAGTCASMRQAVDENRQTEKGYRVNLKAARQYIAEQCS